MYYIYDLSYKKKFSKIDIGNHHVSLIQTIYLSHIEKSFNNLCTLKLCIELDMDVMIIIASRKSCIPLGRKWERKQETSPKANCIII